VNILAVSGSPRKDGNTESLLNVALEECARQGWETHTFYMSQRRVAPCIGCEICLKARSCSLRDDDMPLFINLAANCDAVLIGSPVYYRNVTAQLKAVFDRTHGYEALRVFAEKPAGALAVGRGEGAGQGLTLTVINNYLLSSGAICVPGELNGVTARADEPASIMQQTRRLEQARVIARNVMSIATKLTRRKGNFL
jgi:multimeric flavodoxin WrbA